MANVRKLETRAREAILKYTVENYKQQNENWINEPAIKKAIMTYSLFRVENAILIATIIITTGCLPLLVFPLLGLGTLAWLAALVPLLLGIVAELTFLFFSFKNKKISAKAVSDLFTVEFTTAEIKDKTLKGKVEKALEYWSLIDESIEEISQGVLRDRLIRTTHEVTHWLQAVYNLAERVDNFRLNKVIERDLRNVPKTITDSERKLKNEDNPKLRLQLEKTISDKKRHLQTLQNLEDNMEKAAYQLEGTISSLGTIYSQLLLAGSKEDEGSKIDRLQEEISEQIYRLEDLTDAMDEVYHGSD